MLALPYLFRWDRHGRKGQACAVTARSKPATAGRPSGAPPEGQSPSGDGAAREAKCGERFTLAFGAPRPRRFNSVRLQFADGYVMVTSGNSIRRAPASLKSHHEGEPA